MMMMKEVVVAYYRAISHNFLRKMRKTTKTNTQDGWSLCQDVNLGLAK
jgi:hypothetical protein